MKLRFHKILPNGKSVIFPKDEEDEEKEVISLNVIVFKDVRKKDLE